jgi:LacI family transcriptional regulator
MLNLVLKRGNTMITMKEVSDLAGVSQATVSRVINGSDRVTEKTRVRVNDAMQTLGYRPNSAAQSLASNRTNAIGMVVSELQGPFYGPMMAGVEQTLRQAHKHLIIAAGHGDAKLEREAIEFLVNRQVDGLLLMVERLEDDELVELNQRVPVFLINHPVAALNNRCVSLDNELGGYRATRYLLDQGHRKIACVTGQHWKPDARDRLRGYQRAMAEAGISVNKNWIVNSYFEFSGGLEAMETLLARNFDGTAVFAGNDEMAFGVLEAAGHRGITVPEQLSVIGFDNSLTARYVNPKLTTLHFPMFEMAQASARMALDGIYHKIESQACQLEPTLVERNTVSKIFSRSIS